MQSSANYHSIPGSFVVPSAPPSYEEATLCSQPPCAPPPLGMDVKNMNSAPFVVQPMPVCTPVTVQTVYVQQPVTFYDRPVHMCCPYCTRMITTRLVFSSGALTWLSCGGLCLLGCGAGCCLIPFCVDALKDVDHFCTNCHRIVGSFKRI
ncbi:lipopolysaccharide-induced tumor necrosis factor-alpha factor [Bombina bombina]|uniref:lipopolysaccharide-induced tumor necrosis factor-alpha factor n=1 Tax=Bombina bombina TaxID=8345 RepID=UPI00235A677B|nr:lipopolysaccharide-induced tumor necrosis factor-alpha factor [Bombina bombina]XP_053551203.1 lipopolysaccharide-induced tumor necrosis factor-alpha factor [Bombina bombina]